LRTIVIVLTLVFATSISAQETLFAGYFDIQTNKKSGSKVFGKINLKRNKDAHISKIPETYKFRIDKSDTDIFTIETERDIEGRVFGVLKVAKRKRTGKTPIDYKLTVSLRNKKEVLAKTDILIHVVKKTVWQKLVDVYAPKTIQIPRLYGRKRYSDKKLEKVLLDLENNDGRFSSADIYDRIPSDYESKKALDVAWETVANKIGGLGYSYAKSKKYGVKSDNYFNTKRLKNAIYSSVLEYTKKVPIYGNELFVDGKPVGNEIGDGFSKNPYLTHGMITHQWRVTDPLGAPLVQVWPELLNDLEKGDKQAKAVYNAVIKYYQLFFSIADQRRDMDNVNQRWKNISYENYSEGAWSDANIGHRMRTLMLLPILWADYNRPITYVPYWYDDYYNGTKFEGKTFAKDWFPSGVLADVRSWCDKLSTPSHTYNQSGFHPDGTVTHHSGHHASDVAMYAYGFEWLTTANIAMEYFNVTPYPMTGESYQFLSDRLDYSYRRLVYKNSLDFLVSGRSFYSDMSDFGTKHVAKSIKHMFKNKPESVKINNEESIRQLQKALKSGKHKHTETTAFWNGDYLVHRKENEDGNYYFSVKNKSVRTSGAEDFSKIRKSWHAGSGVLLLQIDSDEYNVNMKKNADWHVLPGVTEGWEVDPMPKGPASLSKPGANVFSGVLSNGTAGLVGYHHKPSDDYTSAEALKSTHLIDNYGIALGSSIKRKMASKKIAPIVTCIDQSTFDSKLTYFANGEKVVIDPGTSEDLIIETSSPMWLHHDKKGYFVFPKGKQALYLKTGKSINITDANTKNTESKNYIFALDHGIQPTENESGYYYVMVANVSAEDLEQLLQNYIESTQISVKPNVHHAVFLEKQGITQVMFFQPGDVTFKSKSITSTHPVLLMIKDLGNQMEITLTDPLHSLKTDEITISITGNLKEGTYGYNFQGIKPRKGESVVVKNELNKSIIKVQMPDAKDGKFYNYKEEMYAGAPIVLRINKSN